MRTYDIHTAAGELLAFEVDAAPLGRRGVLRVVAQLPGVRILRAPVLLSWLREEVFCEFELAGARFHAWEPLGDNSRYWIGPAGDRPMPASATQQLRDAFVTASAGKPGQAGGGAT